MFDIKNLTYSWEKKDVFKALSFTLNPGNSLFIQGSNGCGKTTFLKVCASLLVPKEGEIFLEKRKISYLDEEFKKHSLFLSHELGLKSEAYGREYLSLFQISASALSYFKEEELKNKIIKDMSPGQKKKLVLCRLVQSLKEKKMPFIWILDEGFSGLDIKGRKALIFLIQHHLSKGGIFLGSHHGKLPFKSTYLYQWDRERNNKA